MLVLTISGVLSLSSAEMMFMALLAMYTLGFMRMVEWCLVSRVIRVWVLPENALLVLVGSFMIGTLSRRAW